MNGRRFAPLAALLGLPVLGLLALTGCQPAAGDPALLQEHLTQLRMENESLAVALDEQRQEATQMQSQLDAAAAKYETMAKRVVGEATLQRRVNILTQERRALAAERQEASRWVVKLKGQREELMRRVAELEREAEALHSRMGQMADILAAFEKGSLTALESLVDDPKDVAEFVRRDDQGHVIAVDLSERGGRDDLAKLSGLMFLEELHVPLPDVDDDSLKHIVALPRLRLLDLEGSGISDDGVAMLKALPELQDISLKRTSITDDALRHLAQMPKLTRIRAAQTYIMDSGLAHLRDKENLELLDFRDCNLLSDTGLAHLRGLKNLKDLKVWGPQITNFGLDHLQGLTNLRVLSLQDTGINDEGLEKLRPLKNLQDLKLFRCFVTSKGMPALGTLTKLRRLDLRGTAVNDEGLEHLKNLLNLRELDLSESIVGNDGLQALTALPNLEKLNLWAARVGDAGMVHVGEMTTLKWLNLDDVGYPAEDISLTDEGVKHLAQLQNLQYLHLGKTKVGDAGLEVLAGLPNLGELVITFCEGVTDEGVDKLQQAQPRLKIVR